MNHVMLLRFNILYLTNNKFNRLDNSQYNDNLFISVFFYQAFHIDIVIILNSLEEWPWSRTNSLENLK